MTLGPPWFALTGSVAAVWFWLLVLTTLIWLRRHITVSRGSRQPVLNGADIDERTPAPPLSVLVAAKDEEANIGACLRSLLGQRYAALQIVCANDRSGDRTGAIVDEVAAADPRLTPVHIQSLPAGWAGKNHAMHVAVGRATHEWLCFTDADCRFHDPSMLRAAVQFAQREGVDVLSVLPQLDADSFWEKVIQPPAGAIMVYWFPPDRVNDPKSPIAYANGAFILMTRRAYDEIGGHRGAGGELNEDMHFARVAKQRGLRLRVIRGGDTYSVRMYVGWRQIWNGWTRIFYCCFRPLAKLIASAAFIAIFSLGPTISLLLSPLAGAAAGGVAIAAAAAIAAQQSVLWRYYRLCKLPTVMALTYPLGAAVCLAITFNAMRRYAGARTHWRGTSYGLSPQGERAIAPSGARS